MDSSYFLSGSGLSASNQHDCLADFGGHQTPPALFNYDLFDGFPYLEQPCLSQHAGNSNHHHYHQHHHNHHLHQGQLHGHPEARLYDFLGNNAATSATATTTGHLCVNNNSNMNNTLPLINHYPLEQPYDDQQSQMISSGSPSSSSSPLDYKDSPFHADLMGKSAVGGGGGGGCNHIDDEEDDLHGTILTNCSIGDLSCVGVGPEAVGGNVVCDLDTDTGYNSSVDLFSSSSLIDCSTDSAEAYCFRLSFDSQLVNHHHHHLHHNHHQQLNMSGYNSDNSTATSCMSSGASSCHSDIINNNDFSAFNDLHGDRNDTSHKSLSTATPVTRTTTIALPGTPPATAATAVAPANNSNNNNNNKSPAREKRSVLMNLLVDGSDIGAGYTSINCRALQSQQYLFHQPR